MGDAFAYDAWARRIAAGDWIRRDVFYQSPLYAYWLAGIYGWSGGSVAAARTIQSILGAVSCVLLAKAAEHFFSRRAGWVVGIMMAVYPSAIFFDGVIQSLTRGGNRSRRVDTGGSPSPWSWRSRSAFRPIAASSTSMPCERSRR